MGPSLPWAGPHSFLPQSGTFLAHLASPCLVPKEKLVACVILRELPERQSSKPRGGWGRRHRLRPSLWARWSHPTCVWRYICPYRECRNRGKTKRRKYKPPSCLPVDLKLFGLLLSPRVMYIFYQIRIMLSIQFYILFLYA